MVLAHFVIMGGVAVKTSAESLLVRSHSFLSLMELEEWDHFITQLPSDQDIMDRSKTDIFTIILACLQSLWLVVQCIARAAEGAGKQLPHLLVHNDNRLQESPNLN